MKFIILCLNWTRYFFIQIVYKNYFKRLHAFIYFYFLKSNLKKKKKIIIVYDLSCSPHTYGDFFQFIFLQRYFQSLGKEVYFLILNDNLKYSRLNKKYFLNYLDELKKIVSKYSLKKTSKTVVTDYLSFKKRFLKNDNFILFKSSVLKRDKVYRNSLNLLNMILNNSNKKNLNKILLKNEKKFPKINIIPKNYIAIQARQLSRRDKKYRNLDKERNIEISDLKDLINQILKKKKNMDIIVISTESAVFFKRKLGITNRKIFFSSEFAKNYLETGNLVLNSKLFLAHNATGIGIFAIFSKVPYLITWPYYTLQNEFIWSRSFSKLTSWQMHNQKTYFKMTFKDFTARVNKFLDTYEI